MKKILSLILAGLMTVSCAAFVAADDAAVEATNAEEAFAISFLAEQGIYHGKSTEEFVAAAADPIERWQMALFVGRISTGWVDDYMWDYDYDWEDNDANNSTFTDLEGTRAADYLGAISYANQKGIIEGYSATKFGPTDGITYRDALTMVVRTMGYQGLAYPWGYIEKAVELGLTEGVTATYTTPLNRGQVAVILYNAMFAPTKSGETLAKSIFDVDFGWETIVITATDEAGFANNGKRAAKNYVGFNLIDAAGNIDAKTYYVAKTDLGLENGHDDELAIGYIYDALFTIDGDLATIVKADKHDYEVVVNNGRTDNVGEEVATQPIKAYLDKYSLVKERIGKEYLTFLGQELYIYEKGVYEYFVDTDAALVGIEAGTNNIVKYYGDCDKDDHTDHKCGWQVEWLYNPDLQKYYDYWFDDEADTVYINWMSDAEFEKWYNEASKIKKEESQYVLKTALAGAADTAYAKLVAFNLDADEAAEVALYKDYAIGYFTNDSKKCGLNKNNVNHDHDTKYPTYKITALDDGTVVLNEFVEAGHVAHDMNDLAGLDKVGNGFVWFNVADDVTGFATEDGSYNNGTVLYNWDKLTGEIEVVKYIPKAEVGAGMDEDSGWVTGILQAYSTNANSVTISGEKLYYGYDKLSGVSRYMRRDSNTIANRSVTAEKLDGMLMQYVEALVVDGKVVDIELVGNSNDIIVVLDYAGVTADGYIAVYGYSTKNPNLAVYKINSYNGWKKGDYRYNPDNARYDDAFGTGSIYTIKSYDAATNSYGVYTQNVEDALDGAKYVRMELNDGYRTFYNFDYIDEVTGAPVYTVDTDSIAKMKAADTYVIIMENGNVYFDTGILNNYYAAGLKLNTGIADTYVIYVEDRATVEVDDVVYTVSAYPGAFANNANSIGFILYTGYTLEAAFDDAEIEDVEILGATVSTVRGLNLLTGDYDYAYATTNVDLNKNCVYMTVGNYIVREVAVCENFIAEMANGYKDWNDETATYMIKYDGQRYQAGGEVVDGIYYPIYDNYDINVDKAGLTDLYIADLFNLVTGNDTIRAKKADAVVGTKTYIMYTADDCKVVTEKIADITKIEGVYDAAIVYNPANTNVVIYLNADSKYVDPSEAINGEVVNIAKDENEKLIGWYITEESATAAGDYDVTLDAGFTGTKVVEDDLCDDPTTINVTVDTLTLNFNIAEEDHDEAAAHGLAFGKKNDKKTTINNYPFHASTVADKAGSDEDVVFDAVDCDNGCGLVNSVTVKDLDLVLVDYDVDDDEIEVTNYGKQEVSFQIKDAASGKTMDITLYVEYDEEADDVVITAALDSKYTVGPDWATADFVLSEEIVLGDH